MNLSARHLKYFLYGILAFSSLGYILGFCLKHGSFPKIEEFVSMQIFLASAGSILGLFVATMYLIYKENSPKVEMELNSHEKCNAEDTRFCKSCINTSFSFQAPDTCHIKGPYAIVFLGGSKTCLECGSKERTLWFCVGVPLLPLGSYRTQPRANKQYFTRRMQLDIAHVVIVYWIIGLIAAGVWALVRFC